MEGDESTSQSQSQGQDGQIASENSIRLAENLQGFQQWAKEILNLTKQEEDFSQVTAQIYESKKSKMTEQVTELVRLHGVLINQNVDLIRKVDELTSEIGESNRMNKTMKSVIDDYKMQVMTAEDEVLEARQQLCEKDKKLTQAADKLKSYGETLTMLTDKSDSQEAQTKKLKERVNKSVDEISKRDAQITRLNNQIDRLKNFHAAQERKWHAEIEKLEKEIRAKTELVDDLNRKHDALMSITEEQKVKAVELDKAEDKIDLSIADVSKRDEQITELYNQFNQLKISYAAEEDSLNAEIERLKMEIRAKTELVDDVNKQKGALMPIIEKLKLKATKLDKAEEKMEAMKLELDSTEARNLELCEEVNGFRADISKRDDAIKELNDKIAQMTVAHAAEKDRLNTYTNEMKAKVAELARVVMKFEHNVSVESSESIVLTLTE